MVFPDKRVDAGIPTRRRGFEPLAPEKVIIRNPAVVSEQHVAVVTGKTVEIVKV